MKKVSPPNGVYVVTFIALMLGINSVLGGGAWITNPVRQSSSAFALVGIVSLLVGILDIAVGSLSVGIGFNAVNIAWIIFPLVIVYYLTTNSVKTYLFRKPIGC